MNKFKALLAIVAATLLIGCSATSEPIDAHAGYPQMYTADMLANKDRIEAENNAKFLGAYTDEAGSWILWVSDKDKSCTSMLFVMPNPPLEITCGEGYEAYLTMCKHVGNCM